MFGINFFHKLWRVASFFLLALVCCGQIYQSAHLHHFHKSDSVSFEVGSHPISQEVDHTSTHHHHDEKSSHEDDSEHKYTKKIDWNATRSKCATDSSLDTSCLSVAVHTSPVVGFEGIQPFLHALPGKQERYLSFLIIRGPPQLA